MLLFFLRAGSWDFKHFLSFTQTHFTLGRTCCSPIWRGLIAIVEHLITFFLQFLVRGLKSKLNIVTNQLRYQLRYKHLGQLTTILKLPHMEQELSNASRLHGHSPKEKEIIGGKKNLPLVLPAVSPQKILCAVSPDGLGTQWCHPWSRLVKECHLVVRTPRNVLGLNAGKTSVHRDEAKLHECVNVD